MRDCLMLDIFSIAMYIVGVLLHTYMYTVPRQLTRQNERQTVTSRLPAQDNFPPHTSHNLHAAIYCATPPSTLTTIPPYKYYYWGRKVINTVLYFYLLR